MKGHDLRALRGRLDETQEQFAARFGVSRTNITNWEKTETPKSGIGAVRICEVIKEINRLVDDIERKRAQKAVRDSYLPKTAKPKDSS